MDSIAIFFEAPSSDSLLMTLRFGCSVDNHWQSWQFPQACLESVKFLHINEEANTFANLSKPAPKGPISK